eukprot:NODE_967_length_1084_cov_85.631139_g923_i0.p1 GENE.NODE_967_length_1084_cov_85.631139_g923_i0~~NODE_967_length_1084_cov_85.631139_g923_i0.p1  ORF type:complete len:336 (-),score=60.25 NODE_967_length_1084_cov_85.631139_g923_i0:75-1022(-)
MSNKQLDAFLQAAVEQSGSQKELSSLLGTLASCVAQIAAELRVSSTGSAGTTNTFGDEQLKIDVISDRIVFQELKKSGLVDVASSEEQTAELELNGGPFSVAFDPLDGSSVVDANFSVGSIFGVWPGKGLAGRTGAEQVASCVAMYGPRTTLLIAIGQKDKPLKEGTVFEAHLVGDNWVISKENITIGEGKVFAPGNLRATADNEEYRRLVDFWISERYTLRYTGAMVPDVYHIFVKGKGVFCNATSPKAPAKLRILYEGVPMAFLVECAGGSSTNGSTRLLDVKIEDTDQRTSVCMGSPAEVQRFVDFKVNNTL